MVNPKIWGGHAWYFMHSLRQHYRPAHADKYRKIYRALKFVLPCSKCRKNYTNNLAKNKLNQIINAQTLTQWTHRMHNIINKENKQPLITHYNLPEKLNHQRIIKFFRISLNDARNQRNKRGLAELRRIRRLLTIIFPCLICRNRLHNNKGGNYQKLFNIMRRKH